MPIIRFFLSGICHQLTAHSLYVGDRPLPLCARCTGTFLGATMTLGVLWALGRGRRSELPVRAPALLLLLLGVAWAVDGLNSLGAYLSGVGLLYTPSNFLRLLTGIGFGIALGVLLCPICAAALWRNTEARPVVEKVSELLPLMGGGGLLVGLVTFRRVAPYALWVAVLAGVTAGLLSLVNGLLIALITHKEGFARRIGQVVPYMAGGLGLSLLETGSVALLRLLLVG